MITLEQIKKILWITDDQDDETLQVTLDSVIKYAKYIIWEFEYWERTIQVNTKTIYDDKIWLRHVNPIKITSINWIDFTAKENKVDYFIDYTWMVEIKNLSNYTVSEFDYIEVKYTAWWLSDEIPENLIMAIAYYTWYKASLEYWKNILKEKMWPREVKYWNNDSNRWDSTMQEQDFIRILINYLPIHLRNYII